MHFRSAHSFIIGRSDEIFRGTRVGAAVAGQFSIDAVVVGGGDESGTLRLLRDRTSSPLERVLELLLKGSALRLLLLVVRVH